MSTGEAFTFALRKLRSIWNLEPTKRKRSRRPRELVVPAPVLAPDLDSLCSQSTDSRWSKRWFLAANQNLSQLRIGQN
jgi:hypothetical protein